MNSTRWASFRYLCHLFWDTNAWLDENYGLQSYSCNMLLYL